MLVNSTGMSTTWTQISPNLNASPYNLNMTNVGTNSELPSAFATSITDTTDYSRLFQHPIAVLYAGTTYTNIAFQFTVMIENNGAYVMFRCTDTSIASTFSAQTQVYLPTMICHTL